MSPSFDTLLVGMGLLALVCVMLFLSTRPGTRRRIKLHELLTSSRSPGRLALPEHCVFISYRRNDSADIVGRLYDNLVGSLGRQTVFKDVHSLRHGGDFRTQLDASLNSCLVFLCVMGEEWAGPGEMPSRSIDNPEDYVRIEVETALGRDIPVIPVFVRGTRMPPPDFFPESLRNLAFRHGLPLRPDPDFHHDMDLLVASITSHLDGNEKPGGLTSTGSQRFGG
jgi:hypothetical protein